MKRCWIGAGLLAALLLLGICSTVWMGQCHNGIARDVKLAEESALQENWDRALDLTRQANAQWERCYGLSAALADHGPMEEINSLFAQLETYAAAGEAAAFAGVCAQLSVEIAAMADAHGLKWWNLL